MKTQIIKYNEYGRCSGGLSKSGSNKQPTTFAANLSVDKPCFIDTILKSKLAQNAFKLADFNPHIFNLLLMGFIGIAMRPASIMVVPGAKKEDKEYAAAKSIVGSTVFIASHLALCIPLSNAIKKLGLEAKEKPNLSKFPQIGTPRFEAFSYLVNNAFAAFLTVALSMITVKAIATVMNRVLPNKKDESKNSISTDLNGPNSRQNTFLDFTKDREHKIL